MGGKADSFQARRKLPVLTDGVEKVGCFTGRTVIPLSEIDLHGGQDHDGSANNGSGSIIL